MEVLKSGKGQRGGRRLIRQEWTLEKSFSAIGMGSKLINGRRKDVRVTFV